MGSPAKGSCWGAAGVQCGGLQWLLLAARSSGFLSNQPPHPKYTSGSSCSLKNAAFTVRTVFSLCCLAFYTAFLKTPFLCYEIFPKTLAYIDQFFASLPPLFPLFLPLNSSQLCAYHILALNTVNMRRSRKHLLDHLIITQKKEKKSVFKSIMKGQHGARKVYDQEIYDLFYPGVSRIHLHFIHNQHVSMCMSSPPLCTSMHSHMCSSLPLIFFSTDSRVINILGFIFVMKYYIAVNMNLL